MEKVKELQNSFGLKEIIGIKVLELLLVLILHL